jgi:hypothetical protein
MRTAVDLLPHKVTLLITYVVILEIDLSRANSVGKSSCDLARLKFISDATLEKSRSNVRFVGNPSLKAEIYELT